MHSTQGTSAYHSIERERGNHIRDEWDPEDLLNGVVIVNTKRGTETYCLAAQRGDGVYPLCRSQGQDAARFRVWSDRLDGKRPCGSCLRVKESLYSSG